MLLPQGLLLATVLAGATSASLRAPVDTEAVVELGGTRYRVQALSSTLVRLEAEGPHGFENRSTFFAQNRSSFSGVPISVKKVKNSTTLSTAAWSLELSAPDPDPDDGNSAAEAVEASGSGSTCGNAVQAQVGAGSKLAVPAPAAAAGSTTACCAACDAAPGCTAWLWSPATPSTPAPSPHPGGGGEGPLRAAPCVAGREGQQWKLAGKRGDNGWTSIESANGKNGCWEITGCNRNEGAAVGTHYGCKPVPAPGYSNDCAANGAWVVHKNGTITSVEDGHCLGLATADFAESDTLKPLQVNACNGDKSQQWIFDDKWTLPGAGKPSTVRSAMSMSGDPEQTLCIDNGPLVASDYSPLHPTKAGGATCELYSSVKAIKPGGKSTLGGVHPSGAYKPGNGCAAKLMAADGSFLWSSASFGSASPQLNAPGPSLVSNTTVMAVLDAPRFVPPAWGATPVPNYVNAATLAHANTSGFDMTNHAADLYIFISTAEHALGLERLRSEFLRLSGHVPLLPKWAFGLWFTWYHPYNQSEKTAEVQRFIDDDLGLDIASLDRNWRQYGGTTAPGPLEGLYTENKTLFPDLDGFFEFIHSNNLHIFFNDHPKPLSYGENRSAPAVIPPGESPLGPRETQFRWDGLTSLLARGLDFWWYDCHWAWSAPALKVAGSSASVDGITWGQAVQQDVLTRFIVNGTNGTAVRPGKPSGDNITPFQMGCAESKHPTSHRYSVHWTGDIFSEDLIGSVKDTILGGIEGFKPYVHPDCTAHHNYDEPEVYVRWIQFCSLSNVFRVHSDPFNDRRPWSFGNATGNATNDPTEAIFRNFSHMRLQLLPMLASAAVKAALDGTPLVQRLDFAFPREPEALRLDQYLFLDTMLVAPVNPFVNGSKPWTDGQTGKDPKIPGSFNRSRDVWIPPGDWQDAYSGTIVTGPKVISRVAVPLEQTVLYHKRPSLAVTAHKKTAGQNAATTDLTDLIVEAYPSFRVARSSTGVVVSKRHLIDASAQHAMLKMTEHEPNSEPAITYCGGFSRLIAVDISGGKAMEFHKKWLLRIHLSAGEQLDRVVQQPGVALRHILPPIEENASQTAPVGGAGVRPSTRAGDVLELSMTGVGAGRACLKDNPSAVVQPQY